MLPEKRKAMMLTGIREMKEGVFDMPQWGPDDVLVRIASVGICGSDLVYYAKGGSTFAKIKYPHILGHEAAGYVVAKGENVKNLEIGDRVTMEPGVPCGDCEVCREGKYNLCPNVSFMGIPIYRPYSEGALIEYTVRPASWVYKLPENVSMEEGAMIEPLAVGMEAVAKARADIKDRALILGAGPIALCVMLSLFAHGIREVYAVDIVSKRVEYAKKLGLPSGFTKLEDEEISYIMEKTGGHGVDIIFDTTDYIPLVNKAMDAMAKSGRVVLIGVPHDDLININHRELFMREASLITSFRYVNKYPVSIRLVESGQIPIGKIITHRFDFSDAHKAMEVCLNKEDESGIVEKAVININCD